MEIDRDTVQLGLMGGFELSSGGRTISLPYSAQRVVAFLALSERPLQRIYVAGTLWLDSSERHAGACLRTALWRAMRTGLQLIEATASHLSLAATVELDVRRIAAVATQTLHDPAPSPASGISALCSSSDLLPDWYDEWLIVEQERFRQLRLHALEALCRRLADDGRFGESLEAGLAAVAAEPLRESAHAGVIRTHLAEGNVGEAARHYERYRRLARRHLGIEPSVRLRGLLARALPAAA
jgi:DNA-binding SARP family transcriptional activator